MMDRESLARLLEYDRWANGEAAASLERMSAPPPRAVGLLGHILAAEAGWLQRLGIPNGFAGFWPEADLAALRRAREEVLPALWSSFLADAALSEPTRVISYRTSKGKAFDSAVGDVLLHVVAHSAYHRGQIAAAVRASDGVPAETDFIHAARTGRI